MGNTELSVALAAGGWNVIGLGQGDFRALRSFGHMSKFQGQLVTDAEPKLPAYQLLGAVEKGKDGCSFACEQAFIGLYHGLKKVVFEGRTDLTAGLTKQNFVIQGGCLLVNEDCKPVFQHMFTRTAERWPIEQLLRAVEAAGTA